MVLTVSFVLSPAIGLFCHRRLRSCLRKLDAGVEASGPHDFAVRGRRCSSPALPASTASRPASVTIASRPSVGRDDESSRSDLPDARSGIFLKIGLDRANQIDPVQQIRRCAQVRGAGLATMGAWTHALTEPAFHAGIVIAATPTTTQPSPIHAVDLRLSPRNTPPSATPIGTRM